MTSISHGYTHVAAESVRTKYTPPLNGNDTLTYYANTPSTAEAAYILRHKPSISPLYEQDRFSATLHSIATHPTKRLTREEFIASQPAEKRDKYIKCIDKRKPPKNYIDCFVKREKTSTSILKPPRLIQARNAYYTMELGRYTKPIEDAIYAKDRLTKRYFYKHMHPHTMANVLCDKASSFSKPLFLCLDHTAFDAHVTTDALRMCHRTLKLHNKEPEFSRLLNQQLNNPSTYFHRKTNTKRHFRFTGTVCSGDITTSLYGCLINYHILKSFIKHHNIRKWDLMINGDDSVVIIEAAEEFKLPLDIKSFFTKFNMITKVDVRTTDISGVEFCQFMIRKDHEGYPVAVHKPQRIINRFGMTYKISNIHYPSYLRDLAYGYMVFYLRTNYFTTFEELFHHYQPLATKELFSSLKIADPMLHTQLNVYPPLSYPTKLSLINSSTINIKHRILDYTTLNANFLHGSYNHASV